MNLDFIQKLLRTYASGVTENERVWLEQEIGGAKSITQLANHLLRFTYTHQEPGTPLWRTHDGMYCCLFPHLRLSFSVVLTRYYMLYMFLRTIRILFRKHFQSILIVVVVLVVVDSVPKSGRDVSAKPASAPSTTPRSSHSSPLWVSAVAEAEAETAAWWGAAIAKALQKYHSRCLDLVCHREQSDPQREP